MRLTTRGLWPGQAQGVYYVATGVWPVLDLRSFEAVTGPKQDDWLVRTFGLLIAVVGVELVHRPHSAWLGAGAAAALGAAETVFVAKGRISPVYLLDAMLGACFVGGWLTSPTRQRRRSKDGWVIG